MLCNSQLSYFMNVEIKIANTENASDRSSVMAPDLYTLLQKNNQNFVKIGYLVFSETYSVIKQP